MIENPTTPRERIRNYIEAHEKSQFANESIHSYGKMYLGEYVDIPLTVTDLQSVLNANAGYERIIAEQRREAVEDYKKSLALELKDRANSVTTMTDGEAAINFRNGQSQEALSIAEDLEDGTL